MYWGVDYNDPNAQLEFLPGASVGLRAGWTAEMAPELADLYQEAMKATDNDARIVVLEQIQDMTYEGVAISDPYALDLTLIHVK